MTFADDWIEGLKDQVGPKKAEYIYVQTCSTGDMHLVYEPKDALVAEISIEMAKQMIAEINELRRLLR